MKKALITGALGQDGTYLTEHLLDLDYEVFGIARKNPSLSDWALNFAAENSKRVTYLYGDMRDEVSLRTAFRKAWPDEVYNLAGQVFVPLSWKMPVRTLDINSGGLLRLIRIVSEEKPDTKIYQASSSEMYGNHEGACDDETPFNPTSPYGFSKLSAHRLADLYRERGVYTACGILFNHESPRRGMEMVTRKIAKQVAAWANGDESIMGLGNVESRRDWGFAGEYVKAMHMMLQQEDPDDYVVGTGESHSVNDFLLKAAELAGVSADFVVAHTKTDERMVRTQEIFNMRANNEKIERVLGWRPMIKFERLVEIMVQAEMAALGLRKAAIVT